MRLFLRSLMPAIVPAVLAAQDGGGRMGPVASYLIDETREQALALSAGPPNVTGAAAVYVLRPTGYVKVRDGTNGFTCVVQRGWSSPLVPAGPGRDFWNPRLLAPICYNPSASRTIFPEYQRRTALALEGKTAHEMRSILLTEIGSGKLVPPVIPAIAYMLSAEQWIGSEVERWHPHVMLYIPFADIGAIGKHGIDSGLPLAFDYLGSSFATFVIQVKDFVTPHAHRN